ncbi:MAG: ATP-binding cassette domain-containing protein [Ruthenibacterium sp.]
METTKTDFLLELTGITKSFPGVKALDRVSLKIRPASVHALMGENGAGKSTLMKCLFGIYSKDSGSILYSGREIDFKSPKEALDNGISMVHQELNQVLEQRVMDNIWLGRVAKKGMFLDEKKMYEDTRRIFEDLGIEINPREKVSRLSVSQRQMIEIAKAVSCNAKIIVFDEPTSSLTEKEVEHLFKIIKTLKEKGCGMIYISHKMEEIFKISDDITIMRDGTWVFTDRAENMSMDQIISLMVGRTLESRFPEKTNRVTEKVALEVKNLTGTYQPTVREVSFQMYEGEILGIAGLVGSRRTELVETIFGIRHRISGEILLDGKPIGNKNSIEAISNRFALLTEDRRQTGIFEQGTIEFNATLAHVKGYKKKGLIDIKKMREDTEWVIKRLNVKTPSQRTHIGSLSGGNQQKVILGRWLLNEPNILMLDEPTRGIDVGAKYEIYQLIIDMAAKGKSVMPELLGVTDRIMVMSNGRLAGIVKTAEATQEEILRLSAKYV